MAKAKACLTFWPLFGPNWAHILEPIIILHLDQNKVLNIITPNHDMQKRKNMHLEQENPLKLHFGPFLALIRPILGPKKI